MSQGRILVVDDKENMLKLFCRILGDRYEITSAEDGRAGLEAFQEGKFDLVVTDIRMPGLSGMELLQECKRIDPNVVVILMTAYGEVSQAVEAMRCGAYDYITKPFDPDEMVLTIERALEHKTLQERAAVHEEEVERARSAHAIIGESRPIQACLRLVERAAASDATVLITGESGVGKELFARAIHYASARKAMRFVPINCGAIPKDLVESELFGHVKGAFSGADSHKTGLLEEAKGGTVFLDEIAELGVDVQVKLNRAIQEREIRPVGALKDRPIDVRFVAATNTDLRRAVEEGRFREDLFYRLNVFALPIPPLRERIEDIPLLARHFVMKYAQREGKPPMDITPDALQLLQSHDWPGNVRELENTLAVAVLMADSGEITADILRSYPLCKTFGLNSDASAPPVAAVADHLVELPYREAVDLITREATAQYLRALLTKFRGNVVRAAEHAQIERGSLYRLLRKCGINTDEFQRK